MGQSNLGWQLDYCQVREDNQQHPKYYHASSKPLTNDLVLSHTPN